MAKIKLTKSAVDAAQPQAQSVELRDTLVPGFMCKVTPAGRKVFMLQYRTNAGERRKPALGLYGELTVDQARSLAQEWLAEPLGITVPAWPRDPQGIYFGGNDMLMSPRALLRFGELYRNDGVWQGRRILPEG